MLARRAFLYASFLAALAGSPIRADERSDAAAKQKQIALANLKKLGVAQENVQETDDLFLSGAVPPEKAKALADAMQKQYALTLKALKFDPTDAPWKGKLTLYILEERRQFTSFIRQIEQRSPESGESASVDVRSEVPHIALTISKGEAPAAIEAAASTQVAMALLQRRAGPAQLPTWFKQAFARAIRMRADPKTATADKAAVRKLIVSSKSKPMPVKPADGWAMGESDDKPIIAASVVEYLVFGPESSKFGNVLSGFRQSEENQNPTMDSALMSAGFTPEGLEKAWKKWVTTGK